MPLTAQRVVSRIPIERSIRRIFYQGKTTLADMSKDKMKSLIAGIVKDKAEPYKKAWGITKFLLKIRPAEEIDRELMSQIQMAFSAMSEKAYNKLQKALVLIENPKNVKPELLDAACEYFTRVIKPVFNRVVYK